MYLCVKTERETEIDKTREIERERGGKETERGIGEGGREKGGGLGRERKG